MNEKLKLIIESCVRVDKNLYFIVKNFNMIFKLEIVTGNISIVDSLPEEKVLMERLGSSIVSYGGYLYFAPMTAKKIWRYNISDKSWKSYELKHIVDYESPYCIMISVLYKNSIYFIGGNYPAIAVLDLETDELRYIESPLLEREEVKKEVKDGFFRADYVLLNNNIYLASSIKNEVLRLNLDTYDYEYYTVGEPEYRYSGIGYDGEKFFISPRKDTPAIMWDGDKGVKTIDLPHKSGLKSLSTQGVLCKDNQVIMGSWFVEESFTLKEIGGSYKSDYLNECFWFYKRIDDNYFAKLLSTGILVIETGDTVYKYPLEYDKKQIVAWLVKKMNERGEKFVGTSTNEMLIKEKTNLDLSLFIQTL